MVQNSVELMEPTMAASWAQLTAALLVDWSARRSAAYWVGPRAALMAKRTVDWLAVPTAGWWALQKESTWAALKVARSAAKRVLKTADCSVVSKVVP